MTDQTEAEKKKGVSQVLPGTINEHLQEISLKKTSVINDLSKVEPAVLEAQTAVKFRIRRQATGK